MTGKFGGLSANISDAFKMPIISPVTDAPLKDKDGKEAFIELLSADSDIGRRIDRERTTALTKRQLRGKIAGAADNAIEQNYATIASLTRGWYLLDLAGNPIDVAFSEQNALELYSSPETAWIYRQAFVAVNEVANFIKSSSNVS